MQTKPKFAETWCSQCGAAFGAGDHGYSHCSDHTAAFTPGPWRLSASYPPGQWVFSSQTASGPGKSQCRDAGRYCGGPTTDAVEAEANARLIAAAPELYAALAKLVRDIEETAELDGLDPEYATSTAKDILAKARGERP